MDAKKIKETLKNGNRVYGTLIVSTSPRWLDVINMLGLDFVFIDTEHIAIDRDQLSWMCHAYNGKDLATIVRIPSVDPNAAAMAIEGGANGVVAPYIEEAEEVRALSGAVKFRPVKGKKLEQFLNGEKEFEPQLDAYIRNQNEDNLLFANIESIPAVNNLDEILEVPGLDVVLVGPHDLTCSLGVPEQFDSPIFLREVERIIKKSRKAGIAVGVHASYDGALEQQMQWADLGANLIIHSGDINRFSQAMRDDMSLLRSKLGDTIDVGFSDVNI